MTVEAPNNAKYNADGSGRDTYIRRDPVECFGKQQYKAEPRLITRMGEAGSVVSRERGRKPGETDPVGGPHATDITFARPQRFLRRPEFGYPVEVSRFSTMKEIVQDAHVGFTPLSDSKKISSYQGFQPRCPPNMGAAEWTTVSNPNAGA
jgi:hypothetical protein